MRIVLIGNYSRDAQESMHRYAITLQDNLKNKKIDTEVWLPPVIFGKIFRKTSNGFAKWFAYMDKWIIFPIYLRIKVLFNSSSNDSKTFYHICDHSNSTYLRVLPKKRSGITCHDVLAIRGALGFKDAFCQATYFGKILQKEILKNLKNSRIVISVSEFTKKQLAELSQLDSLDDKKWPVIYNSFNEDFYPMNIKERKFLLSKTELSSGRPFLLHVGSALPRKNRKMLIELLYKIRNDWDGIICFAGQPLNDSLMELVEKLGLLGRVISIVKPDHKTLVALYSDCQTFVFPSYSEGFGWPLIEAQACGAPVLTSSVQPMPEVSGNGALYASPYHVEEFVRGFLKTLIPDIRKELIQQGFKNCQRYNSEKLTQRFIDIYLNN